MKKSQLEKLIKVELKKMLSESAGRGTPEQRILASIMSICKDALDPKAEGANLDEPTKASFREISQLAGYVYRAIGKQAFGTK